MKERKLLSGREGHRPQCSMAQVREKMWEGAEERRKTLMEALKGKRGLDTQTSSMRVRVGTTREKDGYGLL